MRSATKQAIIIAGDIFPAALTFALAVAEAAGDIFQIFGRNLFLHALMQHLCLFFGKGNSILIQELPDFLFCFAGTDVFQKVPSSPPAVCRGKDPSFLFCHFVFRPAPDQKFP